MQVISATDHGKDLDKVFGLEAHLKFDSKSLGSPFVVIDPAMLVTATEQSVDV